MSHSDTWADLRQVVLATTSPAEVAGELRARLGLGRGFGDPELQVFGLDADTATNTLALGDRTVRFVPGPARAGIVAVDLQLADASAAPFEFTAGNVQFRVAPPLRP